jgi:23S rRNA pseudouridine955/2504/2580 synthase/23S rRNA pseudouridine1911/1915/1917 synthase
MTLKLADHTIFQNEDFIAINKPSGVLTIPDREGKEISLKKLLKEAYGDIFVVHRLDRDTSGIVVFAFNERMHKHLSLQFEARETKKSTTVWCWESRRRKKASSTNPSRNIQLKKG